MNKLLCRSDAAVKFTQILATALVDRYGSQNRVSNLLGSQHSNSVRNWLAGSSTISRAGGERIAPLLGIDPATIGRWFTRLENGEEIPEAEIRQAIDSPASQQVGLVVAKKASELRDLAKRTILLDLVGLSASEFFSLMAAVTSAREEIQQVSSSTKPNRPKVRA